MKREPPSPLGSWGQAGRYLVRLGLTGKGRRGWGPVLLAGPRIASTLRRRGRVTSKGCSGQEGQSPSPRRALDPELPLLPRVRWEGAQGQASPGAAGSAYRGNRLGPLGSDHGLQAAAPTAGLVLGAAAAAAARLFKLAGSVKLPPNLDALLGASWGERGGRAGGFTACCSSPQSSGARVLHTEGSTPWGSMSPRFTASWNPGRQAHLQVESLLVGLVKMGSLWTLSPMPVSLWEEKRTQTDTGRRLCPGGWSDVATSPGRGVAGSTRSREAGRVLPYSLPREQAGPRPHLHFGVAPALSHLVCDTLS